MGSVVRTRSFRLIDERRAGGGRRRRGRAQVLLTAVLLTGFEFDESAAVSRGSLRKHQHLDRNQQNRIYGFTPRSLFVLPAFLNLWTK